MDETYTVAAVARRIGVAPATLRTWDRRYGLGPSQHDAGSHRRYSQLDLARLVNMRRLITSGVAPSDAALIAKDAPIEIPVSELVKEFTDPVELVAAVIRAAFQLDRHFILKTLRYEVMQNGVIHCWQGLIVPVLTEVGLRWEKTGEGIEVEHMLTELIKSVLRESVPAELSGTSARPVLLACVDQEIHSLALHALEAALAERDIETNFLGARTPLAAITNVINKSVPPALFLWSQLKVNGNPQFFQDLPKVRPAPKVILGGPGWNRDECDGVVHVSDLQSACDEIAQAIGA